MLFIILIAVALFAALSYAVTQSTRGGSGNANAEKIEISASQIIQYATTVENAIMRMRISNSCSDAQINFANPIMNNYWNPSAPADGSCDVFAPAGGNIPFELPPAGANTLAAGGPYLMSLTNAWPYYFGGYGCVPNVGTGGTVCGTSASEMELMIYLPIKDLELCNAINKRMDGPTTPATTTAYWAGSVATPGYGVFRGVYYNYYPDYLPNIRTGCARSGSSWPGYSGASGFNDYFFYHVLIAR